MIVLMINQAKGMNTNAWIAIYICKEKYNNEQKRLELYYNVNIFLSKRIYKSWNSQSS